MRTAYFCISFLVWIASAVQLPSQDVFYQQPKNIAKYKPGQVINSRKIGTNLNGIIPDGPTPNIKEAWQYLYRTTDSTDNPVAAVATLLMPAQNAQKDKLLVFQSVYDSANNDCSPSYAWRAGSNTTSINDIVFISAALDKGWYVLGSDYEGLNAHFTAGVISGRAVLDSVRAAFNEVKKNGISHRAKYALWGYSGGALATEWAVELQRRYAPELHFEGAALGGLTPSLSEVLRTINGTRFAGLGVAGMAGLSRAYPELGTWLDQNINKSRKANFDNIARGCLAQLEEKAKNMDIFSFFPQGVDMLQDPVVLSAFKKGGEMGTHGVPNMPLFVYEGAKDQIEPAESTEKLISQYCQQKHAVNIEYQSAKLLDHVGEALIGSLDALPWIEDRLNGKPVTNKRCTRKSVDLFDVDHESFKALGSVLGAAVQGLLGSDLGPLYSG